MGDKEQLAHYVLRLTGLLVTLGGVFVILSWLPQDDNPFDGFAAILSLFTWLLASGLFATLGYVMGRIWQSRIKLLPACGFAMVVFVVFVLSITESSRLPHDFLGVSFSWVMGVVFFVAQMLGGFSMVKDKSNQQKSNLTLKF